MAGIGPITRTVDAPVEVAPRGQVEVVPLPGMASDARPEVTVTVSPAELVEAGGYHGSSGVNDLMVRGV